jgi:hypothetical protein
MDARSHERPRQAHHGLVTLVGGAALAFAALSLVVAVAGGLLRACPAPPPPVLPGWLVAGAVSHAALMICGFLGTVVGMERAIATRRRFALLAPAASACGAALLMLGSQQAGGLAIVIAAAVFVVVNVGILRRQPAPHCALLLLAAVSWLVGSVMFAMATGAPLQWWFGFLILTVAAERLEMTRLTRRAPHAELQLWTVTALLVGGAVLSSIGSLAAAGAGLFGTSLLLLAAWLFVHDIARRTLWSDGLSRYMAVCLLAGYGWLAVSGMGWIGLALGLPTRDMALHALGLGFVLGMMMAHAPVILPALTRVRLRFGPFFYIPLCALHSSLFVRIVFGSSDPLGRGIGALLNAVALVLFALTVAGAAIAWRTLRGGRARLEPSDG